MTDFGRIGAPRTDSRIETDIVSEYVYFESVRATDLILEGVVALSRAGEDAASLSDILGTGEQQ